MSEGTDSSATGSETEKLEPKGKPGKNKLLLAIVAVIVAVALILTVLLSGILGGSNLKVTLTPAETASVDAGKTIPITAAVDFKGAAVSEASVGKIIWAVTPASLATLDRYGGKLTVTLKAGDTEGTGTVSCTITHEGSTKTETIDLTVNPPSFDSIAIDPPGGMIDVGASVAFTATAINSIGDPMTGVTFEWSATNLTAGSDYTLSSTTGTTVTLTALAVGKGNLTVKGTIGSVVRFGNASLELGTSVVKTADYRWYDFFNVPFTSVWDVRWAKTGVEQPITTSYPYIYIWHGAPLGNIYYYSDMRLNVTATNRTEINMNNNPEFLPHLGTQKGGNAVISWKFDYMTRPEIDLRFPYSIASWDDGWFLKVYGTTTLDKQAAMSVLGITDQGFTDFATWWATNGPDTSLAFQDFYKKEGNFRLDIWAMYEYALTILDWDFTAAKVGDKIVISQDFVSWGMEGLLTRWMHETFLQTEWYFYNGTLNMAIGPTYADINFDAAVMYSMYMYETTLVPSGQTYGDPCWVFEALTQDYVQSSIAHPNSTFDVYKPFKYQNTAPGSQWYGKLMDYDYTPTTWNLSANETLTFEWPAGDQLFIQQRFNSTGAPIIGETVNLSAPLIMDYSEPQDSDAADQYITPGTIVHDNGTRTFTFTGPIDLYDWSRTQTNHTWLASEWNRMGMLPYGAPYIEWKMGTVSPPHLDHFEVSEIEDLVLVNQTVTMKVTAFDQYGNVFTGYDGTVNFTANRTGALLPANYTFVPGTDAGVHVFTVNLTALGNYTVTCKDTVLTTATGSKAIWAVPTAPAIDHLNVYISRELSPGYGNDVIVAAINQYGTVFTTYNGTVAFSTNASASTYTLPSNYVFLPGDRGNKTFVGGVVFTVAGNYSLTVQDVYNTTATTTIQNIIVMAWPEITYKLYDLFEPEFKEWFWTTQPWGRMAQYYQDYILFNDTHKHAWLYSPNPDAPNPADAEHTTIFAPYRWSIDARNATSLNVHHPEFTYISGASGPQANARVNMTIDMDYITHEEWYNYWIPTWGWERADKPYNESGYMDGFWVQADGYLVHAIYNITMNREAALEWIGLPLAADVATWYNTPTPGGGIYPFEDAWILWITNEGNNRLDIFSGYDDTWYYEWNWMTVKEIQATGEVVLTIAEVDFGWEVLLTRWLTEANLCIHEPYYEDLMMYVNYSEKMADLYLDAVAMYSLRAVAANKSATNGGAWAWEPSKIDYVGSTAGGSYHFSFFDPYVPLTFKSRSAGDVFFGQQVGYDATPWWFNMTAHQKLIIQLPTGTNVPGVLGQGVPAGSFHDAQKANTARIHNYTALMYNGTMDLGFFETGGVDLTPMYNSVTKTLTIAGPVNFDYPRGPANHTLYHGAPWIEFNVTTGASSASVIAPVDAPTAGPAGPVAAGSASIVAMVLVAVLAVSALGVLVRRRE